MKPRIGANLSKRTATRLTTAAKLRGMTNSALVETALNHFLDSGNTDNAVTLTDRISELSAQIGQLDRDLGIVSEIVALHARFHLIVTPELPPAKQYRACRRGSAHLDDFASQLERRIQGETILMQETIDRPGPAGSSLSADDPGEGGLSVPATDEPDFGTPNRLDEKPEDAAAVREDGSSDDFPVQPKTSYVESVTCGGKKAGEAAIAPRQAAPAWRMAVRDSTRFLLECRVLIARVFLPFVAGYYLSYLFRTINGLIAAPLTSDLGLGAGDLGFLTSAYFLTFGAAQIPIGILLDRYGPRRIQSGLLVTAAAGAALFAVSDNFFLLLAGRALMGLGVAAALTAGLKALVLWFPHERVPLLNGLMIMLGALGAVTATSPADLLLAAIGWRGLFGLFAAATAGCAAIIYMVVPDAAPAASATTVGLKRVYTDPRFWRLAPLSATSIGTAWALHGLWAGQWLTDVESLNRTAVVSHLFVMAVAVSVGALLFGIAAERLRRCGAGPQVLLGFVATISIAAQFALILRWPLPSYVLWTIVAGTGAGTVLSYASLAEHFPKELAGRANGLLNFFHIGAAFIIQTATGLVLQHWTPDAGHYPEIAYQTAFALNLVPQIVAAMWFGIPWVFRIVDGICAFPRTSS